MNLKAFSKVIYSDFRLHVAFTLFLIWLLALWQAQNKLLAFGYPLLAIILVTTLDLAVTWFRDHKLYSPSASLVSGFLVGLIISPTEQAWLVAAAAILASISKQFIKTGIRQHIFNPAAFGIIAANLAFGVPVGWWAVAWSRGPLIILIPLMARLLWRMRRLTLPLTFLTVYFIYLSTFFPLNEAFNMLVDGSVLLFALVMLPEPITSQATWQGKYGFGPVVAILAIIFERTGLFSEVFLPALLVANLIGFLLMRLGKTSNQTKSAN